MGLTPSWNGGINLKNIVGPTAALQMISSAKIYDCSQENDLQFLTNAGYVMPEYFIQLDHLQENKNFDFEKSVEKLIYKNFGKSVQQTHAFKQCLRGDLDQLEVASSLFGQPANVDSVGKAYNKFVRKSS